MYAGYLFFASLGAYSAKLRAFDLFLLLVFGLLGFTMRRFALPVLPLILGVILGPMMELKFREALSKLKLKTPLGEISLNENRQATGSVFVTEVSANADGTLSNQMVTRTDNVTQTLGMTADAFRAMGLPSRTTPDCKALGGK